MAESKFVVLDKSFLISAKASTFRDIARALQFVICDASLYELIKAPEPGRTMFMKKFGPGVTEIAIVPNSRDLVRDEITLHKRSGPPSEFREKGVFAFNAKLINGTYELPKHLLPQMETKRKQLKQEVGMYLSFAKAIPRIYPNVKPGVPEGRAEAEALILEPGHILERYSNLDCPIPGLTMPPTNIVTESWAIYRQLQVQLLFALDIFFRYFGGKQKITDSALRLRVTHDVLDADQLLLGCLEGAFATCEKKLQNWFRSLSPNGTLITVPTNSGANLVDRPLLESTSSVACIT
jgi:hypothetical protein